MDPSAYIEMSRTEADHWWFKARRDILDTILCTLGLSADAKLLEVGSGTGGNLEMLSRHGSVSAIEMDASAIAMSETKCGPAVRVVQGHCPDNLPFEAERFDVICMFDVLEHISQDAATLKILRARCKQDGAIVITVPAYQWLWTRHDVHLHHFRRYTRHSLERVMRSAGWQPERLSYFNTFLFPLAVIARWKDRLLRASHSSGANIPSTWLNAAAYHVFRSERGWLRGSNFPFGVSLLCVARPAPGHEYRHINSADLRMKP